MSLVDLRIDVDDYFPIYEHEHRRSNSLPLSPFTMMDHEHNNNNNNNCRRSSFSYAGLPEEPLHLSILKLDGSSFDVDVTRSATVAELREAVEDVFSHMPRKGPGKISWPHVWNHFCLMFEGHKLLTETDYIGYYGIRDGDQLQFVRHISTSYSLKKKRPVKRISASASESDLHRLSISSPYIYKEKEHDHKKEDEDDDDYCYDVENGVNEDNIAIDDIFKYKESRWAGLIQRLFPYSRLPTSEKSLKEVKPLEEQAAAVMRAARAEISAALNKMKKETQAELEQKLTDEKKKKIEAELQDALGNLEKHKEETIRSLDYQIALLSDEIEKKVLPVQ